MKLKKKVIPTLDTKRRLIKTHLLGPLFIVTEKPREWKAAFRFRVEFVGITPLTLCGEGETIEDAAQNFINRLRLVLYPGFHLDYATGRLIETKARTPKDWLKPTDLAAYENEKAKRDAHHFKRR